MPTAEEERPSTANLADIVVRADARTPVTIAGPYDRSSGPAGVLARFQVPETRSPAICSPGAMVVAAGHGLGRRVPYR